MSVYRKSYVHKGKVRRARTWCVETRDHRGDRLIVHSGIRDRAAAEELERKLIRLVALRAVDAPPDESMRRWIESLPPELRERLADSGLLSATQLAGTRPLATLLDAWEEHLDAAETTHDQVVLVVGRARRLVAGAGAAFWTGLVAGPVEHWLLEQRKAGVSARTSNGYLDAARQFIRWAIRSGYATEDPLRSIEKLDAQSDRRYVRRPLTAEELQRFADATASGPARNGVSGPARLLVYQVALETGLRRNEMRTLRVVDFDLDDGAVVIQAKNAKNRTAARLPLRPSTVTALRAQFTDRLPVAPAFALPRWWRPAEWVQADLEAAKIPVIDDSGRVVDFHALRMTFATNLARGGVGLVVAQRMLRHSTPALTSNVYTVLGHDDERKALEVLPEISVAVPAATEATGTDGWAHRWDGDSRRLPNSPTQDSMSDCAEAVVTAPTTAMESSNGAGLAGAHRNRTDPPGFARRTGFEDRSNGLDPSHLVGPWVGAIAPDSDTSRLLNAWSKLAERERAAVLRLAEGLLP